MSVVIKYRSYLILWILLLLNGSPKAQEMRIPVTPATVQQMLNNSPSGNVHPRLFFTHSDIARVKELDRKRDAIIRLGYTQLAQDASAILIQPYLTYHLDDANLRVPSVHKFATQVPPLVLMYHLTGDTSYAERAIRQMELMADWPDWGADRHFLDAGIGAFDFAMVYDGLYEYLSDARKKTLRDAVIRHVLVPGKKQMEKRIWWSTANNNWNGICNGGIIMAALAMYEEDPAGMSEIIALAANNLPKYINAFEPDGQSEEGVMYWSYGVSYTIIALESMHRVLGSSFGLDRSPGFMKTGWFPVRLSGPVTGLSIGDDPVKGGRSRSFSWFAGHYRDTALALIQQDLCLETGGLTWMDMIHHDPGMISSTGKRKIMPPDGYVSGIEVMSLRTGWDRDATFVSMHGGHNNANHGHLDAGSFDIQAMGEVWAYGNLGRDDYTYPGYFTKQTFPAYTDRDTVQTSAGRWHFYRLRAEGKNCIVLDPGIRPDQKEAGVAVKGRSFSNDKEGFHVLDLTDCYQRDVQHYMRAIRLQKEKSLITLQDEITMKGKADLWWQMHTKAAIELSKDGKSAVLKIGSKRLVARIRQPASAAVFTVLPATYIPGRSFPLTKNTVNEGYRKLAIHLPGFKGGSIRVDFFPEGTDLSARDEKTIQIEKW